MSFGYTAAQTVPLGMADQIAQVSSLELQRDALGQRRERMLLEEKQKRDAAERKAASETAKLAKGWVFEPTIQEGVLDLINKHSEALASGNTQEASRIKQKIDDAKVLSSRLELMGEAYKLPAYLSKEGKVTTESQENIDNFPTTVARDFKYNHETGSFEYKNVGEDGSESWLDWKKGRAFWEDKPVYQRNEEAIAASFNKITPDTAFNVDTGEGRRRFDKDALVKSFTAYANSLGVTDPVEIQSQLDILIPMYDRGNDSPVTPQPKTPEEKEEQQSFSYGGKTYNTKMGIRYVPQVNEIQDAGKETEKTIPDVGYGFNITWKGDPITTKVKIKGTETFLDGNLKPTFVWKDSRDGKFYATGVFGNKQIERTKPVELDKSAISSISKSIGYDISKRPTEEASKPTESKKQEGVMSNY